MLACWTVTPMVTFWIQTCRCRRSCRFPRAARAALVQTLRNFDGGRAILVDNLRGKREYVRAPARVSTRYAGLQS